MRRFFPRRGPSWPQVVDRLPVTRRPELWFCPVHASEDLLPWLLGDGPGLLHDRNGILQLYGHTFRNQLEHIGPNTLERWAAEGVGGVIATLPLVLEVGSLKECAYDADIPITTPAAQNAIDGLRTLVPGVAVRLAMDEPLVAADRCPLTVDEAVHRVAEFARAFDLETVGLVEGFPSIPVSRALEFVDRLAADGLRLPFVHLDVDYNVFTTQKQLETGYRDLRTFRDELRTRGIASGVIVWGRDDRTEATFIQSARQLFAIFQRAFEADWPDHLIIQSWGQESPVGPGLPGKNLPSTRRLWQLVEELERTLQPRPDS